MNAADVALIVLAAGKSVRFGGSKLDMALGDIPLGLHVVRMLSEIPFARRIAITGRCAIDYASHGFEIVVNDDPVGDMASSLRLGLGAAGDVAAILVVLADMPHVSVAHVRAVLAAADGPDAIVASRDGVTAGPPALFGRACFSTLMTIAGDHGGRDLIRSGIQIMAPVGDLVDVDTPEDLTRLAAYTVSR